MDNNGTDPAANVELVIAETMAPLREARERLLTQEAELGALIAKIRAERIKLDRVLRLVDPEAVKPIQRRRSRGSGSGNSGYSDDTYNRVWEYMKDKPEGVITSEIARATGLHGTSVAKVLKAMRNEERVRLAGKRLEGNTGAAPNLWKPVVGVSEEGG